MPNEQKKRGRPKGSKSTKPSECLAIYVSLTRRARRSLERLAAHYHLPRSVVIRGLLAQADELLEDGKTLTGVTVVTGEASE